MWHVVVPLKGSPDAKSRLALPQAVRLGLVRAMAADTVAALAATPDVLKISILGRTPDLGLSDSAAADADVVVQPRGMSSLSQALVWFSAEQADPSVPLAVVVADLPALRPQSMAQVLQLALRHRQATVDDVDERGTTVLTARDPVDLQPHFGDRSAAAHRRTGAVLLSAGVDVRSDVDTIEGLRRGQRLGLGPHTSALLAETQHDALN